MFGRKTTLALLTGGLVLAGSGAAVWAATPTPQAFGNEIHACVGDHGKLRLAFHNCRRFEDHISWNRQGPQGPPGPSLNPTTLQSVQTAPLPIFALNATGLTPTAIPGLSVNLPGPGTYLINANVRGIINNGGVADNCFIVAQLLSSAAPALANTQRLVAIDITNSTAVRNIQATAPIQALYTATGPTTVTVQGFVGGNCPANTGVATDGNGASVIDAVRIN